MLDAARHQELLFSEGRVWSIQRPPGSLYSRPISLEGQSYCDKVSLRLENCSCSRPTAALAAGSDWFTEGLAKMSPGKRILSIFKGGTLVFILGAYNRFCVGVWVG